MAVLSAAAGATADSLTGTVRDPLNAVVAGAEVVLLSGDRSVVASTRTDARGRFTFTMLKPATYLVVVRATGFDEGRVSVLVSTTSEDSPELDIRLDPAGLKEEVTVTASRDMVELARLAGQAVNVIDDQEIQSRVKTVVAEAVQGETGVHLQRTSANMAGIFVRGLTGNKVNIFVDGVRYSNGAQRGGVNTFLALIEPAALDSIEVLRGPSSVQYGSDALGGSVQFLTKTPALAVPGGPNVGGSASFSAGAGHRTAGGSVLLALMRPTFGATLVGAGRHTGLIRPGRGIDSHAAVTRFFGISSDRLMGSRLPSTGFDQSGASVRTNWSPNTRTQVVASYLRGAQNGGKRYDQMLGGDGNLVADLNGLSLDMFTLRLTQIGAGPFGHLSMTYSINSQREERVNQGGNGSSTVPIGHEPERTTVHGLQASASRQVSTRQSVSLGGDIYLEKFTSEAFNVNPSSGAVTLRRPRIPSGATFRQGGVWIQSILALRSNITLDGSVRAGGAGYKANAAGKRLDTGQPLWPADALTASNVTFRAGVVAGLDERWTAAAGVSRGFRAPHMTDLGTLGLTGSGFEVAAPDVAGRGGTVGTAADASSVSTGNPVTQVVPETNVMYEGSLRFHASNLQAQVTFFVNNIYDNLQKQALILPAGAAGQTLGGQTITSQNANGAVFVAATTVPVLVRTNFDDVRTWGIESSAQARAGDSLLAQASFTYLRTKDVNTGLPPNIEGGTPAPDAHFSLRWNKPGGKWWLEPYAHLAWRQPHLSSLDLGDRRTGASRSRSDIQAFFRNGARNRGWIGPGPDGAFDTADDVLLVTGETLQQIQDRVLGPGVESSSLFTALSGYAAFGVRVGLRRGAHELVVDAENLTDKNYRGISWGVDAPGRGVSVRYGVRF